MKESSLEALSRGDVTVRTVALRARVEGPTESRKKTLMFGLLVAMVALSLLLIATRPAHAVTLTVNNTADPGDGDCDPNGGCTLREAMHEANHTTADTIMFNIPGSGVKTISPTSRLPTITERLTIDGYSQPGAKANTLTIGTNAVLKIELNGSNAGVASEALRVRASDCVIKGLAINLFGGNSISIGYPGEDTEDNRVVGNFIGTDSSGTLDRGNGAGVALISDPGTAGNTVGGSRPAGRNLISGNDMSGVLIVGARDNAIFGNLIGTSKNGTDALGNSGDGVYMFAGQGGAVDNIVGGTLPETANTIAFNGEDGVQVTNNTSIGNSILRNSIFSNDGLGMNLDDDGETPNDPDDEDTGPNNLQNKPNLTSAENSGNQTTVKGDLNSEPNETFKVRFFSNPSGNEGKKYIGAKSVTTNANGNTGTFTFKPENKVPTGQNLTATATRYSTGDTSEFAGSEEVV
jgi:CSLREA domain-containing protein